MKKIRFWLVIVLACVISFTILLCTGCGAEKTQTVPETEPSGMEEAVDTENAEANKNPLRSIIEAVDNALDQDTYDLEIYNVEQYGINNYSRLGNLVIFDKLEDMVTVLENSDFQKDFYDEYQFNSPEYYYLSGNVDLPNYIAHLLVEDGHYYLSIRGSQNDQNLRAVMEIFDAQQEFDVREVAQLYADLDSKELVAAKRADGQDIYYFITSGESEILDAMGVISADPVAVYFWKQEGILGVLITLGEHEDENLDMCKLEKHEL